MLELMRPPFTVNMKHYISIPQVRSINILTTRAKENSETNFLQLVPVQDYDFDGLTWLVYIELTLDIDLSWLETRYLCTKTASLPRCHETLREARRPGDLT